MVENNDIKEEVFSVLLFSASMMDFKTYVADEALIKEHCECEGCSPVLFTSGDPLIYFN